MDIQTVATGASLNLDDQLLQVNKKLLEIRTSKDIPIVRSA